MYTISIDRWIICVEVPGCRVRTQMALCFLEEAYPSPSGAPGSLLCILRRASPWAFASAPAGPEQWEASNAFHQPRPMFIYLFFSGSSQVVIIIIVNVYLNAASKDERSRIGIRNAYLCWQERGLHGGDAPKWRRFEACEVLERPCGLLFLKHF